jgi:hypothetical protein
MGRAMPQKGTIQDIGSLAPDAEVSARTRELIAKSFELLRMPVPDNFLGHQHRDMIPLPEQEE